MKRWRVAGADLSRVFIWYYNLRILQGQGQRWLLFAPYFMARKIIDPRRVHLVHMEVLCRNGLCSTQCSTAVKWEPNKNCEKGSKERQELTSTFFFFLWNDEIRASFLYWAQGCRLCHVTISWVSRPWLSVSLLSLYTLAEHDNASVTSPSVLMVCFVSFTGGNLIQRTDCGTNDLGQSSCTGVRFQPSNDDVTAPMWQGSVSLSDQLFTAFNWISWIQIAQGIHFQ